mmetsp:Transcript_30901/g.98831  ORF Transcript_30901/g.98831 Transcript_30901/m.98831 type:complete len:340 (-) Transcript_30901:262-1281(-)
MEFGLVVVRVKAIGQVLPLLLGGRGDGRQRLGGDSAIADGIHAAARARHAQIVVDLDTPHHALLEVVVLREELDGREAGRPDHHAEGELLHRAVRVLEVGDGEVAAAGRVDVRADLHLGKQGVDTHVDLLALQPCEVVLDEVLREHAQDLWPRLDDGHLDAVDEVWVPARHVLGQEVLELRRELAIGRAAADDNKAEQPVDLLLALGGGFCGRHLARLDSRRHRSALEALEHAGADLAGVVEVLEEEDLDALALVHAGRAESVRLAAGGDDQKVVLELELFLLEDVGAHHFLLLRVEPRGLCLVVLRQVRVGADGLLHCSKLERADGGRGQEGREEEVV